jgi:hypothetical protein
MLDMYLLAAASLHGRKGLRHRQGDTFWLDEVGGSRLFRLWSHLSGWVGAMRTSADQNCTPPDVWRSHRPADAC